MDVFSTLKQVIKNSNLAKRKIVFPEGTDTRILKAVSRLEAEELIVPILVGSRKRIADIARDHQINIKNVEIIDPNNYPKYDEMVAKFVERRKGKVTKEEAIKLLGQGSYFGTMLVYMGIVDGMVAGAAHPTADTVRPALQIVKTAPGLSRVSGVFIMERGDERYIFADAAMNIDPDSETLSEIGYEAAKVAEMVDIDPKIAFLSFSTKGSAQGPMVDKVKQAVEIFHKNYPDIPADGELQFDAAFVESVATKKAPDLKVAGHANVFIFPELQSANIGYKIAQRLGNFNAVGPILEGLAAPINDLSRGASADDIYDLSILTAVQSIQLAEE